MKGASGQALQNANLLLGLPETTALSDDRADAVSITVRAQGFVAGGLASGIKESGAPDLAMVATVDGRRSPAAGVFTTNLVAAAPVQISRRHLADGRAAAVVLNSGNANAATGERGAPTRGGCASSPAEALGCATTDVLVCSTGLIGIPHAHGRRSSRASRSSARSCAPMPAAVAAAAEAIMTTDTVPQDGGADVVGARQAAAQSSAAWPRARRCSRPSMATMLAVLTTDVAIDAGDAHPCAADRGRRHASTRSVVDGCQSTNDTVLVLANGAAGNDAITATTGPAYAAFADALTGCVRRPRRPDGHRRRGRDQVRARCTCAAPRNDADAQRAARQVASSQLVQCSLYGEDPYWGRILSELGVSGAVFDPEHGRPSPTTGSWCASTGIAAAHDADAVAEAMAGARPRDHVRPPRRQR